MLKMCWKEVGSLVQDFSWDYKRVRGPVMSVESADQRVKSITFFKGLTELLLNKDILTA